MRKLLGLTLALLSTATLALEPGQRAPEFSLNTLGNTSMNLADYRGKVVYLDFWASWCAPCRKSFPWMNALQQRYGKEGFQVLAVNVDAQKQDAAAFLADMQPAFSVMFDSDGKIASLYQVRGMPSSYLIGRDGRIRMTHMGFRESQKDEIEAAIRQSLSGDGK